MGVNLASARVLGPSGRGEIALVLQASYVLTAVLLLGRDRGLTVQRLDSDYLAVESIGLQRSLLRLPMVMIVPLTVAFSLLFFGAATQAAIGGVLLACLVALGMATRMRRASAILTHDATELLRAIATGQLLLLLSTFALYRLKVELPAVWLAAYVLAGLPVVLPYLRIRADDSTDIDVKAVRHAGLRFLPTAMAEIALLRSERLLLPILATYASLGVYVVVATVTELASWPGQQYADSKSPVWAKERPTGGVIWREFFVVFGVTGLLTSILGLGAWLAIEPLFGSAFSSGRSLVLPLGLAAIGTATYRLIFALAASVGDAVAGAFLTLCGFLSAAVLYPLAIGLHGVEGAAWGSAAALLVSSFVGACVLSRDPCRWVKDSG